MLLALGYSATAAEQISIVITVQTNAVGNTNTLTINGGTPRAFTNNVTGSLGTLIHDTNTTANCATQLLNHLTSYPAGTGYGLKQSNPTNVIIRGSVGEPMSAVIAGGWASITYSTNTLSSPTYTVNVPITSETPTNQTNIASLLVAALVNSTNAVGTNWTAGSNYLTKGASPLQKVLSPVLFTSVGGAISGLTGGVISATILVNPTSSNAINYGAALRSEGAGANSLQLGSNALAQSLWSIAMGNDALATNQGALAIGNSALATNQDAMAIGNFAQAHGSASLAVGNSALATTNFATAVGEGAEAHGYLATALGRASLAIGAFSIAIGEAEADDDYGIAIGESAGAAAKNSIAIGFAALSGHSNSVALGSGATTTTTNQVRLGTALETVSVPGKVTAATAVTDNTVGSNYVSGRFVYKSGTYTSLINGNVAGIPLGTNQTVELSGGTTISQLAGFVATSEGDERLLRISGAVTNILVNEVSSAWSTDGTSANRIVVGTGTDLVLTNQPAYVRIRYRGSGGTGRWEVTQASR